MKYAVSWQSNFRHLKDVDEIIFESESDSQLSQIEDLIQPHQTAIVKLDTLPENQIAIVLPNLLTLKTDINDRLVVMINLAQEKFIDVLTEYNIKFMFSNYARTKEGFFAMAEAGACSIYVVEELAFNLKDLQYIREHFNTGIRIFPDIAQSTKGSGKYINPLTKFFIRPEDLELYEDLIDVCEFYHLGDQLSVIYEIYRQGQWLGNLSDIILSLDMDIENTTIAPHFGKMRVNCNKCCLCGRCFICTEIAELAEKFKEADLEIIKKRKKIEIPDEKKEEILEQLKQRGEELLGES